MNSADPVEGNVYNFEYFQNRRWAKKFCFLYLRHPNLAARFAMQEVPTHRHKDLGFHVKAVFKDMGIDYTGD